MSAAVRFTWEQIDAAISDASVLGRGGFGCVYAATLDGERVAIKEIITASGAARPAMRHPLSRAPVWRTGRLRGSCLPPAAAGVRPHRRLKRARTARLPRPPRSASAPK
jgi:hypothetical protein